jgi:hypothetical protein
LGGGAHLEGNLSANGIVGVVETLLKHVDIEPTDLEVTLSGRS